MAVLAQRIAVELPSGVVVTGRSDSTGVETFNEIPYADPPVGQLRLRPPRRLAKEIRMVDATGQAAACPQLLISQENGNFVTRIGGSLTELPFLQNITQGQEDCLTVSVQRPANTAKDARLPVLFWIYGGGFTFGATNTYDATSLVKDGVHYNRPFIYVAVNYRVGGFGFMPGADILQDGSANIGLLDQRMGLEWVADNIASFGGDPDKVTIWGESAGAHSVFSQMALFSGNATYNGKPLFRGAIMNSGSGIPANSIVSLKAQGIYDTAVKEAGCTDAKDRLFCLRDLDVDTYYRAVTKKFPALLSFNGTAVPFPPRPDGKVLMASLDEVAASGQYYAVPMIIGDQEDEGALFSIVQRTLKTDDDIASYFADTFFPNATKGQMMELVEAYTAEGSPFRTPVFNAFYPAFKQVAAIMGDVTFTLSRRSFLEKTTQANPDIPAWSYLSSYLHPLPFVGTTHGTDLVQIFRGTPPTNPTRTNRQYYFNFLYSLDPNNGGGHSALANWPLWKENRTLMWFKSQTDNDFITDDFRSHQFATIKNLEGVLRL